MSSETAFADRAVHRSKCCRFCKKSLTCSGSKVPRVSFSPPLLSPVSSVFLFFSCLRFLDSEDPTISEPGTGYFFTYIRTFFHENCGA